MCGTSKEPTPVLIGWGLTNTAGIPHQVIKMECGASQGIWMSLGAIVKLGNARIVIKVRNNHRKLSSIIRHYDLTK